ncbi:uncharacterized protein A1O9_08015 [Exophiala aquamarina CBS 119918]|uniref:Major facilitator superfamily (MFS) profile domain-containing protein n=1 Tax=Exophiala aquamarina CBS 119918 TaxID=1182545 RepID=A0A072P8K6_9EURO|nr:uncharacterized protein A1O9_08015 [Exophiala aquamarina CBS 119918]KEF56434.1 hypothetical protein A1O9_08015 [Exophiala aquamarina CBS 119918]
MDDPSKRGLKLDVPTAPHQEPSQMEKAMHTTQKPTGPPGPPGGWLYTRMSRQQEILFNIMIAFLQIIPQSTLTTVFPISRYIAQSFAIQNHLILPWLVAAYALSFGTFILIGGRLGDIFGHKSMVVVGYCFMSFWSVVAGLSHYAGFPVFFVARGFQGVAASLMVPNGLALLGRTYPPGSKEKIFSFTMFGLFAPVGAYLGMLFGALFSEHSAWWWGFYTLAIISIMLAVTAQVVLISPPLTPKQIRPTKEKLQDMDWLGAVTGVGGLICVQIALVSAPAAGWSTQYIYMLLIMGLLLIAFFVIVEIKVAEQPLVPFKMLKADVGFVLGAVACGWASFGIWTWFLWKYLLGIKNDTPLHAALHVLPIVPVALVASVLTAWMMRKCRPAWTLFWALIAFTLGPLLLAIDSNIDRTSYWTWTFISLLVMPFGMDMSFPAATLIMSNFFPPHMQGVAGSLISTTVNYSISLGLGLAATVEVQVANQRDNGMSGIRGGWFMGVGLGALGTLVCVVFVVKSIYRPSSPLPRAPPGGFGAQMAQATPPGRALELQPRKDSDSNILSPSSTIVPDSAGAFSPKQWENGFFKKFQFESSPTLSVPTSPQMRRSNDSDHSPDAMSKTKQQKAFNRAKYPRKSSIQKNSHSRNESTQHIISHSRSTSRSKVCIPYSPPSPPSPSDPSMRLPLQPPAALYRTRESFESVDFDIHGPPKDQDPWLYRGTHNRPERPAMYGYAFGSGSEAHGNECGLRGVRDLDGFRLDASPVVPRAMLGDKF